MHEFRTMVDPGSASFRLSHSDRLMLMGSCFADEIGNRLNAARFNTDLQPFGIIYHPEPMARNIRTLLAGGDGVSSFVQAPHGMVSLDHHGSWHAPDTKSLQHRITDRLKSSSEGLEHTRVLILTWGTAWAWEHLATGLVAANCHRLPGSAFKRRLSSVGSIVDAGADALDRLLNAFPGLEVVLTVSPVRHLREGAIGNQQSKSTLLLAAHELVKRFDRVSYFPAYELMMDELRDYRFYKEDMIHPDRLAVDYIWTRFQEWCMEPETMSKIGKIEQLSRVFSHRPGPGTEATHIEARRKAEEAIEAILRSS